MDAVASVTIIDVHSFPFGHFPTSRTATLTDLLASMPTDALPGVLEVMKHDKDLQIITSHGVAAHRHSDHVHCLRRHQTVKTDTREVAQHCYSTLAFLANRQLHITSAALSASELMSSKNAVHESPRMTDHAVVGRLSRGPRQRRRKVEFMLQEHRRTIALALVTEATQQPQVLKLIRAEPGNRLSMINGWEEESGRVDPDHLERILKSHGESASEIVVEVDTARLTFASIPREQLLAVGSNILAPYLPRI